MKEVQHENTILRSFILCVQTALSVRKYVDAELNRRAHLSIVRWIVLRILANNGGTLNPSELAEWTQTEPHNITAVIGRMRNDGLVTTERNEGNKRQVNVILTEKGQETLDQAMLVAEEIVDRVMLSVSEDDAIQMEKTIRVIRQNTQCKG